MSYHNPVLLKECIKGLNIKPNGTYVDVTFGSGGYSSLILTKLKDGRLISFDQDQKALDNSINNNSFKLIHANFRYLRHFLRREKIDKIDGLLADLGVSSHQFDNAERGFSIRLEGDLDMRMNTESSLTAKDIVNNYTESELSNILFEYGDIRNSRHIAKKIVIFRSKREITTTNDLIDALEEITPHKKRNQFLARVFQSIRIEVNDEINSLKEMLSDAIDLLSKKGRIVILSYHSIEDRLVKNLFKKGNIEGVIKKDFFGNINKPLNEINTKVIVPSLQEVINNSRSKSAKLRIAEKI